LLRSVANRKCPNNRARAILDSFPIATYLFVPVPFSLFFRLKRAALTGIFAHAANRSPSAPVTGGVPAVTEASHARQHVRPVTEFSIVVFLVHTELRPSDKETARMSGHSLWQRLGNGWRTGPASDTARGRPRLTLLVEELENRLAPASVTYAVTQDWTSGFQANLTIKNEPAAAAVANWTLEFDYAAQISSIWDAQVVSRTGNHYVIRNAGWNGTIAPGGTVSFGLIGSPGSTAGAPTGFLLNGSPLGTPPPVQVPALTIGNATTLEPTTGTGTILFDVNLSAASATPVTVHWQTADGSALAGSDYQAASGTLTFAPGQTHQTIAITINSDSTTAPSTSDTTFQVRLTNPNGATLASAVGTGTIRDTTPPPAPTGNVTFRVGSDWGSGFTGEVAVRNPTSAPLAGWTLAFDFPGRIDALWNAELVSHVGTRYVVKGASWNATLPAGGTVAFGFNGSPGNVGPGREPTNFALNGAGGGGTTNRAPVAGNDSAFTLVNQAVPIVVLANDTDPDGDLLMVSAVGAAQHGTVVQLADGTLRYTPMAGYVGGDSFAYTIDDGHGHTASATVNVMVSAAEATVWPARVFAPYVDATAWPTYDFVAQAQTQGTRFFTLGFVVAGPNREPAWGGFGAYAVQGSEFSATLAANITALRALGGDVMVSFGGAANQELAQVITSVTELTNAYQSVIDAYQLTHVDFDIEGAATADPVSVARRSQAIAALQQRAAAAGKTLEVTFTLPVLPSGLTVEGRSVLQSALAHGVVISRVNIMAMDYGASAAPNPQGRMGAYAIAAAESLFLQLQALDGTQKTEAQLWKMVGITPMIGVNDVVTEVFTPQDAQQVLAFAVQHDIGELSMWSVNRDTPSGSGIVQHTFAFANVFEAFTG